MASIRFIIAVYLVDQETVVVAHSAWRIRIDLFVDEQLNWSKLPSWGSIVCAERQAQHLIRNATMSQLPQR